ncbi:MAG: DNA/RNA non-specific endonuclease [Rikenellaceae bacterium]
MKKYILGLSALAAVVACQQNEQVTPEIGAVENQITFTVGQIETKVSGSNFEDGDIVTVYAYTTDGELFDKANYSYSTSNSQLEAVSTPLGYESLSQELTFYATYPATTSTSFSYEANADQSSAAAYEASDLLVAQTVAIGDTQIALSFDHKLSSIVVNLSGETFSDFSLSLKNTAACNIITGSYNATNTAVSITAAENGTNSYKAIIAPQVVASGATFASLTIGEETVSGVFTTSVSFASEKQLVFDWDLTEGEITCNGAVVGKSSTSGATVDPDANTKYSCLAVLPSERTDKDGDYYYAYHSSEGKFNFAACYSSTYTCPVWTAGAYHSWYVDGSGSRTDDYASDPDIDCYQVETLGSPYNRGHLIASSDRLKTDAMNRQAFYLSNISPQLLSGFNAGGAIWNNYEDWIQDIYPSRSDTLYIVNGSYWDSSATWFDGTRVPSHYYKACLRLKQANSTQSVLTASRDELECVVFFMEHVYDMSDVSSKYMITVDELEELTGENFFANVPNAPEDTFTASDWGL